MQQPFVRIIEKSDFIFFHDLFLYCNIVEVIFAPDLICICGENEECAGTQSTFFFVDFYKRFLHFIVAGNLFQIHFSISSENEKYSILTSGSYPAPCRDLVTLILKECHIGRGEKFL